MNKKGKAIMEENRINEGLMNQQSSKEAQLRVLKQLQEQQQEMFYKRMQIMRDPSELKELSQVLLDRKKQIEELEQQIQAEKQQEDRKEIKEEKSEEVKETSLVKVDERVSIFQIIKEKLSQLRQRFEKWLNEEPSLKTTKQPIQPKTINDDYEFFAQYGEKKKIKSWELSPEKLAEIRKGQVEIAQRYSSNEQQSNIENKNLTR